MEFATFEAIRRGNAKLELNEPLKWELKEQRMTARNRLRSALSVPVTLVVAFGTTSPWKPTFILHDGAAGKNNACRLDVRASHRNRRSDGRSWIQETHLHIWRDDLRDSHAIDPLPPWPPVGFQDSDEMVTSAQLELIFEVFCRMFHVKLGGTYHWVDPLLLIPKSQPPVTEDGDVIP